MDNIYGAEAVMRIVDRKTFLSFHENTLYSEYEPCMFGPLMIKGETLQTNDWLEQQISNALDCTDSLNFFEKLELARTTGVSLDMDFECYGRNDRFEPNDRLFVVYEKKDIQKLIDRLKKCLDE